MKLLTGFVMCGVFISVSGARGAELPSLERGEKLFTSQQLGTSGKSCATCHKDNKGFSEVATTSDADLADTINRCITGPLKGQPLDPETSDMKSLVLYLKSFAGTGK